MIAAIAQRLPLLAAVVALAWAPVAAAQETLGTLTVRLEDNVGLADDERFELQYGLEQIVTDYGEFTLVPSYELETLLTTSDLRDLEDCGTEPGCLANILEPVDIDFAMVVVATAGNDGYDARILAVDLGNGRVEGEQEGFFPEPGDSLFLLAPAFEALSGLAPSPGEEPDPDRVTDRDRDRDRERDPIPLPEPEEDINVLATSMIAGGGILVAVGLAFWIMADDTQEEIQASPHDLPELADMQGTGQNQATLGNVGVLAGAAVLVAGIVFQLTGIGADDGFSDFDDDDDWSLRLGGPGADPYVGIEVDFP